MLQHQNSMHLLPYRYPVQICCPLELSRCYTFQPELLRLVDSMWLNRGHSWCIEGGTQLQPAV